MTNRYDVIVAGVGGMGSAACWQLARRGLRVLGLERYDIPHAFGSSHGVTRIIRLAYHESPAYVPLVRRAIELWREAGAAVGEPLLFTTGSLDAGPGGGAFFAGSLAACRAHDLPHEILDGGRDQPALPGYRLPATIAACSSRTAALSRVGAGDRCACHACTGAGADVRAREAVRRTGRRSRRRRAGADADRATYEAGRLILSPGAWISRPRPVAAHPGGARAPGARLVPAPASGGGFCPDGSR